MSSRASLTISLTAEQFAHVKARARALGTSRSELVRRCIVKFFNASAQDFAELMTAQAAILPNKRPEAVARTLAKLCRDESLTVSASKDTCRTWLCRARRLAPGTEYKKYYTGSGQWVLKRVR